MRLEELSQEELARLLREAKDAHAEYERELGEQHEDWPSWYAGYMLDRLREGEAEQPE
jgi:hypothetical protein